ncbi:MAG: hypothetical protein NC336_01250 [Clostridium sp.]|nr:hypothetical protein [Clostridium sp.]
MTMILMILGAFLLGIATAFCFIPRGWSALAAFAGMICLNWSGAIDVAGEQLWFWGAAAVIVFGLSVLLPTPVVTSRRGVAYVVVATIAGLFVGLLVSANVMVLGGVVGAFCGALAYSRTPAGRVLDFPSRRFTDYLCAKALPPVITLSIVAIVVMLFIGSPHIALLT